MRVPSLLKRASWNLIDQAISSITNAVLSFVVARSVDEATFGGFAAAFTVFALLVGVSRAVATSPLPIRFSSTKGEDFRGAASASLGTAFTLGFVAGVACVGGGLLAGGLAGNAVVALGVVLPGLLVQDAWRQVFFAQGRPEAAALNDAVWAVVQFAAVAGLLLGGMGFVGPLVLAWGGAGLAAAALGIIQGRTCPRPGRTFAWLRAHRDITGYSIAEFGTQQAAMQGALLVIAAVGSLAAIGALRGVQVLLGVTTILAMAAASFALPEFARRRDSLTGRQWMIGAIGLGGVIAGFGALWGVVFLVAPDWVGRALLGDTWDGVSAILLASIVGQFALAANMGPATMARAMDRTKAMFSLNVVQSPLVFVCGVGGVLVGGARGAAWGFAIAYWVTAPLWWMRLHREIRRLTEQRNAAADTAVLPRIDASAG